MQVMSLNNDNLFIPLLWGVHSDSLNIMLLRNGLYFSPPISRDCFCQIEEERFLEHRSLIIKGKVSLPWIDFRCEGQGRHGVHSNTAHFPCPSGWKQGREQPSSTAFLPLSLLAFRNYNTDMSFSKDL